MNNKKLNIDTKVEKKTKAIIVLDNNNKKKVIAWLRLDEKKVLVIRSGINTQKFNNFELKADIYKKFRINKNSLILACANLLAPHRRYEDILMALSLVKTKYPIHLIILSKLDFDKYRFNDVSIIQTPLQNEYYIKLQDNLFYIKSERAMASINFIEKILGSLELTRNE